MRYAERDTGGVTLESKHLSELKQRTLVSKCCQSVTSDLAIFAPLNFRYHFVDGAAHISVCVCACVCVCVCLSVCLSVCQLFYVAVVLES